MSKVGFPDPVKGIKPEISFTDNFGLNGGKIFRIRIMIRDKPMDLPLIRSLETCKVNRIGGYLIAIIVDKLDQISYIGCIFSTVVNVVKGYLST